MLLTENSEEVKTILNMTHILLKLYRLLITSIILFIFFFETSKDVFTLSCWDLLDKKWCRVCDEVIKMQKSFLGVRINKYDACSELDYKKYDKLYNGT